MCMGLFSEGRQVAGQKTEMTERSPLTRRGSALAEEEGEEEEKKKKKKKMMMMMIQSTTCINSTSH